MSKRLVAIAVLALSTAAYAFEHQGNASVHIYHQGHQGHMVASIDMSEDGHQRLYTIIDFPGRDSCRLGQDAGLPSVAKFNGQHVKMHSFCNHNGQYSYISATPASPQGIQYVVNEFKRKSQVQIEFADFNVVMPAAGFNRAWGHYGGDAI
ncbi:hypothetical protein [Motilimonas pumila]|uniref:DUF2796 domain-containing protein n=1 Tax=Motilimonas pumila TaxID=2303987 RepID=A0A418YDH5_9GAMM|nr:hypothetical protein [Motilimonas pumila]RJG42596.1 hypothetical protein D1Z90_12055 [Motilimonas pumila]